MELKKLISPEDNSSFWKISYNYDYMFGCPTPSEFSLIAQMPAPADVNADSVSLDRLLTANPKITANSLPLYPMEAGLPWHTSINVLRQNKHWKPALTMKNRLLELFSADDTAMIALQQRKRSYADVATAAIGRLQDNWSRFTAYLWPAADQRRLELIAATMVFVFVFDDIWEMSDDETIRKIQVEFISRLKLADAHAIHDATPFQMLISDIMQGFYDEDLKEGSGGKDVIERLVDFCNHPPPKEEFTTLREFLDYRMVDAAAQYVFACVKFSLRSNVDIASPRIARFMSLAADHMSYANDLGSFDKEKEAYLSGDVLYLINAVDMVQKVFNLEDSNSAKSVTLALQLQIEEQMTAELSRLRALPDVTDAELEFVQAVVYALVGTLFTSVVMCRYGGEAARIST